MLSYLGHRAELGPVPFGEVADQTLPFPSEEVAAPDPCS